MELVQEMMREWYLSLNQLSVTISEPVKQVSDWVQLPLLSVLLLGFVGSLSPCQLTTNLSAMAYVSRRLGHRQPWPEAFAYTLGKVLVYMMIGGAVIFLGLKLEKAVIPAAVASRKAIGPLMIIIGLSLIGLIRLRGSFGGRLAGWLQSHLPQRGVSGAFSLGVVFSFAFCPTLFWLFFGLMIPLALGNTGGWTYPGAFALGTTMPLLLFTSLLAFGSEASGRPMEFFKDVQPKISRISGVVFILAGINDTLTYLFL